MTVVAARHAYAREGSCVVAIEGGRREDVAPPAPLLERGALVLPPTYVPIVADFDHWRPMGIAYLSRRGAEIWARCRIGSDRVAGLWPALGITVRRGFVPFAPGTEQDAVHVITSRDPMVVMEAEVVCVSFCRAANVDRRVGALVEFHDPRVRAIDEFRG